MKQIGHLESNEILTEEMLKQRLNEKIESTYFNDAKKDVANLLKDQSSL